MPPFDMSKFPEFIPEVPEVPEVPENIQAVDLHGRHVLQRHLYEDILKSNCTSSLVISHVDSQLQVFKTTDTFDTIIQFPKSNESQQILSYNSSPGHESMTILKTGESPDNVWCTHLEPEIFFKLLEYTPLDNLLWSEYPDEDMQDYRFLILPLMTASLVQLRETVNAGTVWETIKFAVALRDEEMTEACVKVLQRDTLSCIFGPNFLEASEEGVALLLEQDVTQLGSEMTLISAVESWARHQAQARDKTVREILEPRLLSKLRFLSLSPVQFINGLGRTTWLSDDEKEAIWSNFLVLGKVALPEIICKNTEPRGPFMEGEGGETLYPIYENVMS